MVTLYAPQEVASWRHLPSWLLLSFGAGATNAGALLACATFVSHVSGTATRLGVDVGQWDLMLEYGAVLASFVLGAMASVLALGARVARGLRPLHGLPLLVVAGLLLTVALLGERGVFGPFGGEIEQAQDFAMLCLLGFAMGLQNATVSSTTGMAVRTTHMTGPATDLGIHLANALWGKSAERTASWQGVLLRASKLGAFLVGSIVAVPLARSGEYLVFAAPAVAVVIAAASSFFPSTPTRLATQS